MSRPADARPATSYEALARTVLYEGFALYPYRASAPKNRRRILFGTLWPEGWAEAGAFGEPCRASTEVLLRSRSDAPRVGMTVRYLRLTDPPSEASFESSAWSAVRVGDGVFRVRAEITNTAAIDPAAPRDAAEQVAMGAAHVVLTAGDGAWVSAIDPPPELAAASATCAQEGLFPVLVGPRGATDTVLAAPIILYDHPEVAPESAGDLFDATEIEEILSLRVHTLTDAEKDELRASTRGERRLLERVEALGPDGYARLHGAFRGAAERRPLRPGVRVRLVPRTRADAFDVLLRGMEATVQTVEHTACGQELVCVTIDRDPGRDLGAAGMPGHRFFFRRDEMEVLP